MKKIELENLEQKRGQEIVLAVTTWLAISLLSFFALFLQEPPSVATGPQPDSEFASSRALQDLRLLTRPHPTGSEENAAFRERIKERLLGLGLQPEIQECTVVNEERPDNVTAATVHNIIALIKGAENSRAVLLVAHYDSAATGPGVGDDGSGVAILLETARALRAGAPLKNDIMLLFTDGEEIGLLGARAFVESHPWIKQVGVVLNFEARGSSGPSIMFETTRNNGWLIREFARVAPHPVANSLSYEIYRRLPNDTDLTIFKRAGLEGLNFAFIGDVQNYHSQLDTVDNLDERSLQHQGAQSIALAKHFGQLQIGDKGHADAIYFNLPGSALIHYPQSWAAPLAFLALVLFAGVVATGMKNKKLSPGKTLLAALCALGAIVGAILVVQLLWWVSQLLLGPARTEAVSSYSRDLLLGAFAALTVALIAFAYNVIGRKLRSENLIAGASSVWLLLAILSSILAPGASYILTWPLLFYLTGLAIIFKIARWDLTSPRAVALSLLCALPAIALFVPLLYLILIAVGFQSISEAVIMIGLLLGMLIPQVTVMMRPRSWPLPAGAIAVAILMLTIAFQRGPQDRLRPAFDSLFYALNADTGKAIWASYDDASDEWTSKFLSTEKISEPLDNYLPSPFDLTLKSAAPALPLAAPSATLLEDHSENGVRSIRLNIKSQRQAPIIRTTVESYGRLLSASVNGKSIGMTPVQADSGQKHLWQMTYWAPPQEGIILDLRLAASQSFRIRIADRSFGLPCVNGKAAPQRPEQMIPAPSLFGDFTAVSKSFSY